MENCMHKFLFPFFPIEKIHLIKKYLTHLGSYKIKKSLYLVDFGKESRANPFTDEVIKSGQARKGTDESSIWRGTHSVQLCRVGIHPYSPTIKVLQSIWPCGEPSNGVAFAPLHCYWCTTNLVDYSITCSHLWLSLPDLEKQKDKLNICVGCMLFLQLLDSWL